MVGTTASILVIGAQDTGKTHYGGQLLGRLQVESGKLALRGAPADLEPFEEVLNRLAQGRPAGHTPREMYAEIVLPLLDVDGSEVDVIWPDYGGEQISRILDHRSVGEDWQRRIRTADGWLFFIRPLRVTQADDVFSRPLDEIPTILEARDDDAPTWSQQAWHIELLQALCSIRRLGYRSLAVEPRLSILLSCWDEIDPDTGGLRPEDWLQQTMPLLWDFVRANWVNESWEVFGLSSLGLDLDSDGDETFIDKGPESHGYVVIPSGGRCEDLSIPVQWLLEARRQ